MYMKIIISPAKKMKNDCAYITAMSTPVFIEKSEKLKQYLQSLSYDELKKLQLMIFSQVIKIFIKTMNILNMILFRQVHFHKLNVVYMNCHH